MDNDCIKGRKLNNIESVATMFPDALISQVEEFDITPLINTVSSKELLDKLKKIDYSVRGCNLDDESKKNNCWNCSKFVFPIGCMVGEEVGEGGKPNQ